VGISYKPFHSLEIYGNISQNYRSVTFNDIRIINPTLQVDPAIKDEKGYSADIGVRGNIKDIFNYDASLFSLSYGKRIGEVWKENSLIKIRTNVGKAWIFGLEWYNELQLLKAFGNRSSNFDWSIYSNIAVIHSRYTQSPYENVKGKEVEFIPTLNIKTGTQLGYKQFKASIQYSYLSSQYTDAQNSTDADPTATVGVLPAYGVMDISLSWQLKKWLRFEGSVNNVTNKMYATRRASGYPGPGLLPADGRSFFLTAAVKL
jgi:Fe(3+) dicitrate transport protein